MIRALHRSVYRARPRLRCTADVGHRTDHQRHTRAGQRGARDGWNYADWVVGAVHVRSVDPNWPAPGSRVHHRLGAWPLTINDATEVTSYEPERLLSCGPGCGRSVKPPSA